MCVIYGLINEIFELVTVNRVKADLAVLCDAVRLSQRLILVPSRGGNAKDMLVLIQSKKALPPPSFCPCPLLHLSNPAWVKSISQTNIVG